MRFLHATTTIVVLLQNTDDGDNKTASGDGSSMLDLFATNVTSSTDISAPIDVERETSTSYVAAWIGTLAALHLLVICIVANVLLVVSARTRQLSTSTTNGATTNTANGYSKSKFNNVCSRWTSSNNTNSNNNINKNTNNNNNSNYRNVEILVTLIAGVGLLNGSSISIAQIVSHLFGGWLFNNTYCKLHGMASNLMMLLVIWYEALFAFERYLKFAKPQDYQVTFSKINLQIIALGIFLVLMSAISGPIYGWGTYTYSKDAHMCELDLTSPNAVSYFALSTASYVVTPYVIMAYSCSALLLNIHFPNHRDQFAGTETLSAVPDHLNSLERRKIVLPLAVSVAASFLLQLPKYALETTEALHRFSSTSDTGIGGNRTATIATADDVELIRYVSFWMHTFAVNGCFACVLLLFNGCTERCCCSCCCCCCCCCTCRRRRQNSAVGRQMHVARTSKSGTKIEMSRKGGVGREVDLMINAPSSAAAAAAARRDHQLSGLNKLCSWLWPLMNSGSTIRRHNIQRHKIPIVLLNRVPTTVATTKTSSALTRSNSPFLRN